MWKGVPRQVRVGAGTYLGPRERGGAAFRQGLDGQLQHCHHGPLELEGNTERGIGLASWKPRQGLSARIVSGTARDRCGDGGGGGARPAV